jgi:hypothetical protein
VPAPVADSFNLKLLVGKIVVISMEMDPDYDAIENRMVFFENLDARV